MFTGGSRECCSCIAAGKRGLEEVDWPGELGGTVRVGDGIAGAGYWRIFDERDARPSLSVDRCLLTGNGLCDERTGRHLGEI